MYAPVVLRCQTYGVQLRGAAADYAAALVEHPSVQTWVAAAAGDLQDSRPGISAAESKLLDGLAAHFSA